MCCVCGVVDVDNTSPYLFLVQRRRFMGGSCVHTRTIARTSRNLQPGSVNLRKAIICGSPRDIDDKWPTVANVVSTASSDIPHAARVEKNGTQSRAVTCDTVIGIM